MEEGRGVEEGERDVGGEGMIACWRMGQARGKEDAGTGSMNIIK